MSEWLEFNVPLDIIILIYGVSNHLMQKSVSGVAQW